jgi:hypothetical protein
MPIAVYLESGSKRVFASALEWPGWCRSGKDATLALNALAASAPRYALVAAEAGLPFPVRSPSFDVVERIKGSATTDFGAPGEVPASDRESLSRKEAERVAVLVAASWTILDRVVKGAPEQLRKGPRGGGRDRDAIVQHVNSAEAAYSRKLGLRLPEPSPGDRKTMAANRRAILEALGSAAGPTHLTDKGWPSRYAARRIAWHTLDHAWEIEDRREPYTA